MGKRKGKGGGGARKGAAFERKLCVALSNWVSGGKQKDLFWRTSMSGGRATVMRRKGEHVRQSGDICAVAPEGHPFTDKWYVEAKFYKDVNLQYWLLTGEGKIEDWWSKTVRDAEHYERIPFMIVKENGMPPLLFVPEEYLSERFGRPLFTVPRLGLEVFLLEKVLKRPYQLNRVRLKKGV
jgi:hypothetical protein